MSVSSSSVSTDTITITVDDSMYTTSSGSSYTYGVLAQDIGTISLTNTGAVTGTIIGGGYSSAGFNWSMIDVEPFDTGFPEWTDFQNMCKEYPGLEKTFEHMKAFYKLCKDDWEAKKKGES